MLAAVVVLTVCAGFYLRSRTGHNSGNIPEITVICSPEANDSVDSASRESDTRDIRKSRRRSAKGKARKKTISAPVSRDFLSDSVKIKPRQ